MLHQDNSCIAGKQIISYSPRGNKTYSINEITQFLRQFQLNKALNLIGKISHDVLDGQLEYGSPFVVFQDFSDVPVSPSILAYIAMKLIECSNDYRSKEMQLSDLLHACDMYFGLVDPLCNSNNLLDNESLENESLASLVRFGSHQFDYDKDFRNSLSRTIAIYKKLWGEYDPQNIDICKSIKLMTGLSLEEALFLGDFYFFNLCEKRKGYFQLIENVTNSSSVQSPKKNSDVLELSKQEAFVSWISRGYKKFRQLCESEPPPDPNYDKYRFNNLTKYPIVVPEKNLIQGCSKTYIVPVGRLLFDRVTNGLYFDLTEFFSEPGKKNPFRESFGKVFQEYVGTLFKEAIDYADTLPEWRYKKPNIMTPDWIITDGEKTILVEVKQSCLYKQAKVFGNIKDLKENLNKTIGKGVRQLWTFETDIQSNKYDTLKRFLNCTILEKLIVTYDRCYFYNSILRNLIQELHPDISENYFCHIIAVEELERLLGISDINIFQVLEEKRLDSKGKIMDFKDYMGEKYAGCSATNHYLDSIDKSFLNDFK